MRIVCLIIAAVVLLVAAAPAGPAHAAEYPSFTFEAIDAVDFRGSTYLEIEGLLEGEAQPRKLQFTFYNSEAAARCDKAAMMVIAKPGRFGLKLSKGPYSVESCVLSRR